MCNLTRFPDIIQHGTHETLTQKYTVVPTIEGKHADSTQRTGNSLWRKPRGDIQKDQRRNFLRKTPASADLVADTMMSTDPPFPHLAPRPRTWNLLIRSQLAGSRTAGDVPTLPLLVPAVAPPHSHRRVSNLSDNGTLGTPCCCWPAALNSFRRCHRWIAHDCLSVGNTASGMSRPARA